MCMTPEKYKIINGPSRMDLMLAISVMPVISSITAPTRKLYLVSSVVQVIYRKMVVEH